MSTTEKPGHGCPVAAAAALRKEMSKPALWATSTLPRAKSRNEGNAVSMRGAPATVRFEIPVSTVMKAGIAMVGRTRV